MKSKTLVVEDKWFASIHAAIDGEVQRLTQALAERVKGTGRTLCPVIAGIWRAMWTHFSAKGRRTSAGDGS